MLSLCTFAACGNNNGHNAYNGIEHNTYNGIEPAVWEYKNSVGSFVLDDFFGQTAAELNAKYRNKCMEVTFEITSYDKAINTVYYSNSFSGYVLKRDENNQYIGRVEIDAYTLQNYWDVPFYPGDKIKVKGYFLAARTSSIYYNYEVGGYITSEGVRITINPCIVEKA
jgi:hypothetical protein